MQANGVVDRKLALLDRQIMRLQEALNGVSQEQFAESWEKRTLSERALQVCVEIVIDVAERIIALRRAGPVATAADAIERLVDLGVLSSTEPYQNMVRFRNLIVHQYEEVDPEILFDLATRRLDDFRAFRDEIDRADWEDAST